MRVKEIRPEEGKTMTRRITQLLFVCALAVAGCASDGSVDDDIASDDDDDLADDDSTASDDDTTATDDDDVLDDDTWGDDDPVEHVSTECDWIEVRGSTGHTCGLHADGTVECWGCDDNYGQCDAPPGSYTQVSPGGDFTCVLAETGLATCFGSGTDGATDAPTDSLEQVRAGTFHACGIAEDGGLTCWGATMHDQGQTAAPAGVFSQVSAGRYHSCALDETGTAACWGCSEHHDYGQGDPPDGLFVQISSGRYHSCALASDGSMTCWGENAFGESDPQVGPFAQVTTFDHTCGLHTDGSVECWGCYPGSLDLEICEPPNETFHQITLGADHVCGIRDDACIHCWSDGYVLAAIPP